MKSFRIYLICICTMVVGLTATGCATDLSGDGLGGAEGGLDYSIDAVDSTDISSDEEFEAEAADFVAKPVGTCKCNPAPDSTGRYRFKSETCSLCTNSADCATASCIYEHRVHGGEKDVKCHFKSGTMTVDELETIELEELDGSEEQDSLDRSDALAAPGTCSCNPAPDSSGNWAIGKENCSLCTDGASCSTAKCWYKHSVHGGLKNVGCRYRSGTTFIDSVEVDAIELDESLDAEQDSDNSFSMASSCICNNPPSSQGGWYVSSSTCRDCKNSADCTTGRCWYTNSDGDQQQVGCRWGKLKKKKKKKKKKIDGTALLDF